MRIGSCALHIFIKLATRRLEFCVCPPGQLLEAAPLLAYSTPIIAMELNRNPIAPLALHSGASPSAGPTLRQLGCECHAQGESCLCVEGAGGATSTDTRADTLKFGRVALIAIIVAANAARKVHKFDGGLILFASRRTRTTNNKTSLGACTYISSQLLTSYVCAAFRQRHGVKPYLGLTRDATRIAAVCLM